MGAWWVWAVAAAVLAAAEALAPGWVFLGFALGAAALALALAAGGPLATLLAGSAPLTLLAFALLSLVGWAVLRRAFGVRRGQVKIWRRDVNDD